jgi:multicomponent Na+:H+ antiporter subunit F
MQWILDGCIAVLLFSLLLSLYRMIEGPTSLDRVLCIDAITVCIIGILACLIIQWKSAYYTDFILAVSIIGFFTTIAFANYLEVHYSKDQDSRE